MTKSTQILDVSYGTFSCRLEGFEDSVETMKTVVSYFHDLAGHDRFMDMEPQAPDLETLSDLASEQAGTAVEIAADDHGVSLRAAFDDADDFDETDEDEPENIAADDSDLDDDGLDIDEDPILLTATDDEDDAFEDEDFTNILEEEYSEDLDVEEEPQAAQAPAPVVDDEESIAAKLQRIRAVVGRGHVPPAPVAQSNDDEDVNVDADIPPVNPLAQRLADLAKRNLEHAIADDAATAETTDDDLEDQQDDAVSVDAHGAFEDDDETVEVAEDDDLHDVADDNAAPLVLTAAIEDDNDFEDDENAFDDDEEDDNVFGVLNEEESDEDDVAEDDAAPSKRDDLAENVDSTMGRIFSQTDEHLNAPEGRRHRDAFAQLKAAVAATEAARQLGDEGPVDEKADAFREDLDAHDEERVLSDARDPAPLRLVPAQRRSDDAPVDAAAERLRRIASKKEDTRETTTGGFAQFAADQGATELGDLLEAAAAYIAFVEGDDDFSRPQVMRKVQSATDQEISREDGLRSFGRLLRQSKIVKLTNGRFQVSENTKFRPDGTA